MLAATLVGAVVGGWLLSGVSLASITAAQPGAVAPAVAAPSGVAPGTSVRPTQVLPPAKVQLPPELAEVARLAQSGVDESVVLSYVRKTPQARPISADQIIYLHDLGITSPVLEALVEQGSSQFAAAAPQPGPPANVPGAAAPGGETPPAGGSAAPPVTGAAASFYDALAPYGSWLYLPGYGWCWQPTVQVVNPSWQPYSNDGYWLSSNDGWYWNSDYSWGWAPFHYGRWCDYPDYGWLWCPDNVWGPAWVCWRDWGDYCGWAPLPFGACFTAGFGWTFNGIGVGFDCGFGLPWSCFSFVPLGNFCDRDWYHHRLDGHDAHNAFDHSRVNNNFAAGSDHHIINRGIDPARVEAASHSPVRQVSIRDLPRGAGASTQPGRVDRVGNTLTVYRPGANVSVGRNPALASLNASRAAGPQFRTSPTPRPGGAGAGLGRGTPTRSANDLAVAGGWVGSRAPAAANSAASPLGAMRSSPGSSVRAPVAPYRSQSPTPYARSTPPPSYRPNDSWQSRPARSAPRPSYSAPTYGYRSAPSWSAPRPSYSQPSFSGRSFSAPSYSSRPSMSFGGGRSSGFSFGGGRSFGGGGGGGHSAGHR